MGKLNALFASTFLAAVSMSCAVAAYAAESDPIMMALDAGVHIGRIRATDINPQLGVAVTASADKITRVWDLKKKTLRSVLRTPIGQGLLGEIHSVALRPDGREVAISISPAEASRSNVFVFSPDGAFLRALRLPRDEQHDFDEDYKLTFSPDSNHLIAVGYTRLITLDTATYQQRAEQTAFVYHPLIYTAVGFVTGGKHLALVEKLDYQSTIRVCEISTLACNDVFTTFEGSLIESLAFSPAADKLVFNTRHYSPHKEKTQDEIIYVDVATKKVESRHPTTGSNARIVWHDANNFALFSYDDISLYTAQPHKLVGTRKQAGGWPATASRDGIFYLRDKSINFIAWTGNRTERNLSVGQEAFAGAFEVETARFLREALGNTKLRFTKATSPERCSYALIFESDSVAEFESKLECANLLKLPSGGGYIHASKGYLSKYDRQAKSVWVGRRFPCNYGQGMTASMDGSIFAVRCDDGAVRFFRSEDGEEFLAYYQGKKGWVAWTPSGFFATSPGAADLVGWYMQRADKPAPDYFPASRFRGQFHRPEVVERVLVTLNEKTALADVAKQTNSQRILNVNPKDVLPPLVALLSPGENIETTSKSVTLKISVTTSPDAPIGRTLVRVNGQPSDVSDVAITRAGKGAAEIRELAVPLRVRSNDILVFAENRHGMSAPVAVHVTWTAATQEQFKIQPKLYVLAIGISAYANPELRLQLPAKDARDFAQLFQNQKRLLYSDVEVRLLIDKAGTRTAVVEGLEWLEKQVTRHDVGILFLAGHGVRAGDNTYYFAPVEFDVNSLRSTGVVFSEIKGALANLAGKAVFFIDTCHSGSVLGTARAAAMDITAIVDELSSAENGVIVFSASTGRQLSYEKLEWGNGAFTKAVLEGLSGKADVQASGRITHKMLDYYVSQRVKELTGGRQHPVTQGPGGVPDFPLVALR